MEWQTNGYGQVCLLGKHLSLVSTVPVFFQDFGLLASPVAVWRSALHSPPNAQFALAGDIKLEAARVTIDMVKITTIAAPSTVRDGHDLAGSLFRAESLFNLYKLFLIIDNYLTLSRGH